MKKLGPSTRSKHRCHATNSAPAKAIFSGNFSAQLICWESKVRPCISLLLLKNHKQKTHGKSWRQTPTPTKSSLGCMVAEVAIVHRMNDSTSGLDNVVSRSHVCLSCNSHWLDKILLNISELRDEMRNWMKSVKKYGELRANPARRSLIPSSRVPSCNLQSSLPPLLVALFPEIRNTKLRISIKIKEIIRRVSEISSKSSVESLIGRQRKTQT